MVASSGTTVHVAGQTGERRDGSIPDDLVEQFDGAVANVVEALRAAGAAPDHVVSMQIFTTDLAEYMARAKDVGVRYRSRFGTHYPAMALVEVKGLVGAAKVEITCVASMPDAEGGPGR